MTLPLISKLTVTGIPMAAVAESGCGRGGLIP